ncbi:MAG: FkbM family methyltransferase [Bacteroidota bacterium]
MGLKIAVHRLFRKIGYDFRRYHSDNFPELNRIKIINKQNINLVLDIGASEGLYAAELREAGYKGRIISFEPLGESFKLLNQKSDKDTEWDSFNIALGESDGEVEMNVSGHITSSSLLPMTDVHLNAMQSSAIVSKEKIKVRALNSFLGKEIKASDRIYLKVDVQGFEMFVLRGADKILDQVEAIEIELSLAPLYKDVPLFLDMIKYLESLGFMIVSMNSVFSDPNTDQLLQVDGIFKRKKL